MPIQAVLRRPGPRADKVIDVFAVAMRGGLAASDLQATLFVYLRVHDPTSQVGGAGVPSSMR